MEGESGKEAQAQLEENAEDELSEAPTMTDEEQAVIESKAIIFIDSLQHEMPERTALSNEQIMKDEEELATI